MFNTLHKFWKKRYVAQYEVYQLNIWKMGKNAFLINLKRLSVGKL
jgi:hypothetical protein